MSDLGRLVNLCRFSLAGPWNPPKKIIQRLSKDCPKKIIQRLSKNIQNLKRPAVGDASTLQTGAAFRERFALEEPHAVLADTSPATALCDRTCLEFYAHTCPPYASFHDHQPVTRERFSNTEWRGGEKPRQIDAPLPFSSLKA